MFRHYPTLPSRHHASARFVAMLGLTALLAGTGSAAANDATITNKQANTAASATASTGAVAPRNIILLIGDGMGFSQVAAYRQFADNPATPALEATVFDDLLVGTLATRPFGEPDQITDSAAGATAYSCGIKTRNGAIGVDADGKPCLTVLELAKQQGKRVGVVATSQLTHATPASFYAHVASRKQISDIAAQLTALPAIRQLDVAFAGGSDDFSSAALNTLRANGVQIASDRKALAALTRTPALALLSPQGLPMAIDRSPAVPALAELTEKALTLLGNPQNGFFLMVEGSQIDWASHANDIVGTLSEMQDFAAAIAVARRYATQHPDTLIVITADHETGGLALGHDKKGYWQTALLRQVRASAAGMAARVLAGAEPVGTLQSLSPIRANDSDRQQLLEAGRDNDKLEDAFAAIVSRHSLTGWSTTGHTGADVPLYAVGPGSEALRGHHDNSWLGQLLLEYVQGRSTAPANGAPLTQARTGHKESIHD